MPRFFNNAGPNVPEWHYTLPMLDRLPTVRELVQARKWFVLHAPRQSGKTTAMRALAHELTASGQYAALWATCEMGEPFGDEPGEVAQIVINDIDRKASLALPPELRPPPPTVELPGTDRLASYLKLWCSTCPRPVVLLLDEIDALRDDALISVLRQLRGLYPDRPNGAPVSLALIGLRDVRDYKIESNSAGRLGTASPFNVKAEGLTLGNFTAADVAALYGQHTAETGQQFTPAAVERAYELTQGQPWLVNALAYEITFRMKLTGTIDVPQIDAAKERLILSRSTHLDSLADKLNEPRVRAVVGPILAGTMLDPEVPDRDIEYCEDLGIVTKSNRQLKIANPIYQEILPRELTWGSQRRMVLDDRRWALDDGRLDIQGILRALVEFWRENGEWMVVGQKWPEFAHQIVVMAFLQRLVNGGGTINREYGLGRKRLDLLINWHLGLDEQGIPTAEDRHAIECKVWHDGQKDPLAKGLEQLDGYLARLGLDTGTLLLFDARSTSPKGEEWETRGELSEATTPGGRTVTVLRL